MEEFSSVFSFSFTSCLSCFWNEFQNKLPSLDSDFGDISVISNVVWEQRIVSPLIPHNPLLCSTPCCIRGGIYILQEKQSHFHKRKKSLSPEYLQDVPKISKDSKSNGVSRILPIAPDDEALAERRGPKEKPEDIHDTEDEAEAESKAATADGDALAESEGPKEKPEDTEDEAAAADEEALPEPKGSKEKPEDTLNTEYEAEAESEADAADESLVSLIECIKCK